jgi:hypothetical protein
MRCDAKLFICAQLRMCAEDGESQTLLIISALIRMSALKNILEGLQLALNGYRQGISKPYHARSGITSAPASTLER